MFDNDRAPSSAAYAAMIEALPKRTLPEVGLSSEHWFDDVVFNRLTKGQGLPYPGGKAVLVEFTAAVLPAAVASAPPRSPERRLAPVIAHPERYQPMWKDDSRAGLPARRCR